MKKFFEVVGKIATKVVIIMWIGWAITIFPTLVQEVNKMRELPFNGIVFFYFLLIGAIGTLLVYEIKGFIELFQRPTKTNIRVFFNGEEVDADIKTEKD